MRAYRLNRRWMRVLAAVVDGVGGWVRRGQPRRRATALPAPETVEQLLLVRRERFGDLVLLQPAIARAQRLFLRTRITLWVRAEYVEFCRAAYPQVEAAATIGGRRFDLACEFHGDPRLLWAARRHARWLAGYGDRGGGFLCDYEAPYEGDLDAAARAVRLVEAAAGGAPRSQIVMPRLALAPAWAQLGAQWRRQLPEAYVVLHPGCGQPAKRWPLSYWRQVGEFCRRGGWEVVVAGAAQDQALAWELAETGLNFHDWTGGTTLGGLAALVAAAAAVISPDTGVAHLARALGTPAVALFGPTDPQLWGRASAPHVNLTHRLACSHCDRGRCPKVGDAGAISPCMAGLLPAEVCVALDSVVGGGRGREPAAPKAIPAIAALAAPALHVLSA